MLETPPALTIRRSFQRPPRDAIAKLEGAMTGQVADALGGLGALDASIKPIADAPPAMKSFVGSALPCMNGPADQLGLVGALAYAEPGDVLVVGTEAYLGTAVIGDLMAGMLLNCGVAGLVTDGAVRDTPGIIGVGLPVFCAGVSPNSPQRNGPGTVGLAISIGGVTVNPGDILVGDVDGVVVVPQDALDDVINHVDEIKRMESEVEAKVKDGLTYPDSWRAYLEPGAARFVD
ncbi:MAG: RraA family protein [Rhodospirillaceae bacterium]|nr:RraA family protein [Rhodospirillaceae bacterium]